MTRELRRELLYNYIIQICMYSNISLSVFTQITATPCPNGEPVDVQCGTVSGQDWKDTGQVGVCCPKTGFYCANVWNQIHGQQCLNYRVRFKCPLA